MKIAIAARGLDVRSGGAREYVRNLVVHLPAQDPSNEYYIYYSDASQVIRHEVSNVHNRVIPTVSNLTWDHFSLPMQLRRDQIELTLFPKGTRPIFCPGKSIIAVLDLGYFYPGLKAYPIADTLYMQHMIPFSARHAQAIIAISSSTRLDLLRLIPGLAPEKISVIHLAAATANQDRSSATNSVREKYGLGHAPYIFMASSLSPRKNIERALLAISSISSQIPHILVLTGGKQWGSLHCHPLIRQCLAAGRFKVLGHVPGEDLPALYREADLYLMPSLFEGFSMTILEAMQYGCPVAVSNVCSHPEVAGDAAVFFDPYSTESISKAILSITTDPELHEQLSNRGRLRAAEFSWERCALETTEFIHKVAGIRP